MRRSVLVLALALGAGGSLGLANLPCARAQDDGAAADYKAIQDWLQAQAPKTAEDRAALRVELAKRCRAFLKSHADAGAATDSIRDTLADVLFQSKKLDDSLAQYELLAKSQDARFAERGRAGVVKCLVRKDRKAARARLDAYLEAHPDEPALQELDKVLKDFEKGSGVKVGAAPPAIEGKTLAGDELSLAKLEGKVVLVDFWATWCPPCKKELPGLKKLYSKLHAKGFEIVGVDFAEKDPAKLKEFLRSEQLPWPQVVDAAKPIARAYHVDALPRTVLVDKEGKVAAIDLRGERLARAVEALVEGKPIPADEAAAPKDDEKGEGAGQSEGE